jgi:hypothetical protein
VSGRSGTLVTLLIAGHDYAAQWWRPRGNDQ